MISLDEWHFMIEFIVILSFIEPKSRLEPALRSQLPPPLVELLASAQFMDTCMQTFDGVDEDKSG